MDNQNWAELREQPMMSRVTLEWQGPTPDRTGIAREGRSLFPRVAKVSRPQFIYPPVEN